MLNKNEIKYIQSLGLKKNREAGKAFITEGPKIVEELLTAAPQQIQKIYALENWAKNNESLTKGADLQVVSVMELERLSHLQTPNEVIALVNQFEDQRPSNVTFALYLDTIQDPGNLGTIIRIADWFGIAHVICSKGCTDIYNPKVVQATMASILRVSVHYDMEATWLRDQQIAIYAATLDGTPVYEMEKLQQGIFVIGNESKGISQDMLSMATQKITIPKKGGAESLNAAVATGIILSHLV
jgi:TrmH family RNA methyltransferase